MQTFVDRSHFNSFAPYQSTELLLQFELSWPRLQPLSILKATLKLLALTSFSKLQSNLRALNGEENQPA